MEGAYIRRGFEEGNLGFKIDWTGLIVGRNLLFFLCFTLYFDGNFQEQAPGPAYIWRSDLTEGFLGYEFGGFYLAGIVYGGAYFRNFTLG